MTPGSGLSQGPSPDERQSGATGGYGSPRCHHRETAPHLGFGLASSHDGKVGFDRTSVPNGQWCYGAVSLTPSTAASTGARLARAGIVTDTVSGVQVRRSPGGRWYPFTRSGQRWWPAPGASPQADAAFTAALRARRAR